MARVGPETRLVKRMRDKGNAVYGPRIKITKYHGGAMGEAGVSDLLICLDGVFVAIEVKAPDNYGNNVERAETKGATDKQLLFIKKIEEAGGVGAVCASVESFLETLARAEKLAKKRKKRKKS